MQSVVFNGESLNPSKIVCIGRNYVEHARELGNDIPTEPVIFLKPNSAISQQLNAFHQERLHYEAELCFLIKNQKLAGLGIGLDLTKRQLQAKLKSASLPWERAKAFNGAAVLSDFIELPPSLDGLSFSLVIDGEEKQRADISQMLFSPGDIIDECSSFMQLYDGDIIMTGTPKGVGEVVVGAVYEAKVFIDGDCIISARWQAV